MTSHISDAPADEAGPTKRDDGTQEGITGEKSMCLLFAYFQCLINTTIDCKCCNNLIIYSKHCTKISQIFSFSCNLLCCSYFAPSEGSSGSSKGPLIMRFVHINKK